LKVHHFALICLPEMAMLLVEALLCKSLVKDCTESTFSSSTAILLLNSSNLVSLVGIFHQNCQTCCKDDDERGLTTLIFFPAAGQNHLSRSAAML
jgi:hypothetical protein